MGSFDEDDDDFVVFGTGLEPIEEDEIVRKKPVGIQDQVVLDEQGRRRFHGAFTGGFSAGYYNTVGSKEGWAPTSFKSTRNDRSSAKVQSAQDFMDEEDLGAFGIAPQVLRPTEDFQSKRREGLKRPRPTPSDGPIPGEPVLFNILQPARETIGIKVLRKMGWRPGQGIGPKVLKKSKKKEERKENEQNLDDDESGPVKIYGCSLPPRKSGSEEEGSSDEENLRSLLVAPDEVTCPLYSTKDNTFGLGYQGLDKNAILSGHVDLFGPSLKLKVDDRKMNIMGEAFGIGAFEEEDEEVYSREDMSQYDFALETPHERKRRLQQEARDKRKKEQADGSSIPGFIKMKVPPKSKHFPRPRIPEDFEPVHALKKSRFSEDRSTDKHLDVKKMGLDRHQLSRQERQVLLEDEKDLGSTRLQMTTTSGSSMQNSQTVDNKISTVVLKGSAQEEPVDSEKDAAARRERLKKFTEILQNFSSQKQKATDAAFKPFMKHPGKQERYESYLTLKAAGYAECLKDLQPPDMTEWERERENLEFERASELYKPVSGELSSRFVSAKSHDISHMVPEREREKEKDPSQDPKVAAKMNLFGKLTHQVLEWHPDRLVCKRFNVPPPYPNSKMVGVRSGASGRKEPELQESISKKSLFDDLDFSKPPPGLVPVASQLLPPTSDTASTSASSQPQLEFLSTQPAHSSTEETPSKETTLPTKPPLDLFKKIFADTSESESEDAEAGEQHPPIKDKTIDRELGKEGGSAENRKKRDDKKIALKESLLEQKEKTPNNAGKSQRHEETQGIFHNLDFSQLSSRPSNVSPSASKSLDSRNDQEKFLRGLSDRELPSAEFSKEKEDAIYEECTYGPAPPSDFQPIKKPTTESSTNQNKRSYNYSSILSPKKKFAQPVAEAKESEEIMWVEKNVVQSLNNPSKRKHSKKLHKSHHHRSSKSKKAKKHKSSTSKHKSKKHKRKSSKNRRSSKSGHRDKSPSSSSSSEQSDSDNSDSGGSSDQRDYPSVSIYNSDNSKALIAKLKEMI